MAGAWRAAVAVTCLFALAAPARAEQRVFVYQTQVAECANQGGVYSAQVSIAACTAVIRARNSDTLTRAMAYNHRGERYDAADEDARALADFTRAVRTYPQLVQAYLNRASYYVAHQQYARAVVDYTDVIRITPRGTSGYNGRCWTRAMWNASLDLARADCDAALEIAPGTARILDSRGMVGLRQGRFEDAWNDYNAAVAAEPGSAHYLYGRGVAALRLGREAEGRADLAAATAMSGEVDDLYAAYGVTP